MSIAIAAMTLVIVSTLMSEASITSKAGIIFYNREIAENISKELPEEDLKDFIKWYFSL